MAWPLAPTVPMASTPKAAFPLAPTALMEQFPLLDSLHPRHPHVRLVPQENTATTDKLPPV